MRGYLVLAGIASAIAAVLLAQLSQTAELVAWEILVVLLLFFLWRVFPSQNRDRVPSLFSRSAEDRPIPPRSVSTFELASIHANSEAPGADRRLKVLMTRIARHRLAQRGIAPESARANELIDPVLFQDRPETLTKTQIARIVEQLENL